MAELNSFTISISDPFNEKCISTRGRPLEKNENFSFFCIYFQFPFFAVFSKNIQLSL
jgi:hypothetical protein